MSREEREAQARKEMTEEIVDFAAELRTVQKKSMHLDPAQVRALWERAVSIEALASDPQFQPTVEPALAAAQQEVRKAPVALTLANLQNATGLLRDAALANTHFKDKKVVPFLAAGWAPGAPPWRPSCLGTAATDKQGGTTVDAAAVAAAVLDRGPEHALGVVQHAFDSAVHLLLAAQVYAAASEEDPVLRTALVQQLLHRADAVAAADAGAGGSNSPSVPLAPLLDVAEDCPELCAALATATATIRCMYGAAHPLVRDCVANAGPLLESKLNEMFSVP